MELIAAVITIIIGSTTLMGFVTKFLLKETNSRLEHLEKIQERFENEIKAIHTRIDSANKRSDDLYSILIDKVYGVKK